MVESNYPSNKKDPELNDQSRIYHTDEHDIDPKALDSDALYVIYKLRDAGHSAYLVGGSVRDLLIKNIPKDFDVSTSALPEDIKQIFKKKCILIGRRFRLAHIRFGHKVIEVSTFRGGADEEDLILQDNQWGTAEDDVRRRDFTINGLFYDPVSHTIIDYVGGWEDIHNRVLRSIGDPRVRFKQDPVRMIRLLKFRARFNFDIDEEAKRALITSRKDIIKSSPARILEEVFKMLESGASAKFFRLMTESGLLILIFPYLARYLESSLAQRIYQYLQTADKMNLNSPRKPLDRSILLSCLLYPILEQQTQKYIQNRKDRIPHLGEITIITSSIIREIVTSSFSRFPRRTSSSSQFILTTQYRFTPLSGKMHHRPSLYEAKDFMEALKFLKIRALIDPSLADLYHSWKKQYELYEQQHQRKGKHHPPPEKQHHRRRSRHFFHRREH